MLKLSSHTPFSNQTCAGTCTSFCAILLAASIGAGPQLPKGDLAPPPRVRWAEPWDQLSDAVEEAAPPKPAVKQVTPPPQSEAAISPLVIGNGFGSMGRLGHLADKTFGRNDSITPLEVMPYLLTDEHFIFSDLRGFVTNRSEAGGNLGIGYRRLVDKWNAWGGASVWYDADQSTGRMFQQIGLSFETLVNQIEFRANVYLPFTSSQSFTNSISGSSFVGNQLLYTRTTEIGAALRGIDFETGYSLPVVERHVIRSFIGGYHFEGGSSGGVNGFKARVEGVINNTITAQALYTHDKLYGDNVMVGLSIQFPFGNNHPSTGWNRSSPSPFRFVERNYNVIVDRSQSVAANQVASDPTTGNPYVVEQVASPGLITGGTPDGTGTHPFATISAAQIAGGNVIYVQKGSVLTESVTLSSGQHLFGQAYSSEYLPTLGGERVPIPNRLQSTSMATPIFQNVTGPTLILASNTEVAGFNISGGGGISGSGVSGVSLHDLVLTSIQGDAVNLANASGNIGISNLQINSASGNGTVFSGGNPDIVFSGMGSTISAEGNGVTLANLSSGSVALNQITVKNVGGTGLLMNAVASNATIDSLTVSQSGTGGSGSAISITGNSAASSYTFSGLTSISMPDGAGFAADGTDAKINVAHVNVVSSSSDPAVSLTNTTNPITIGNLSVNTTNATGLFANQASGLQVNAGALTTINAAAIDVEASGFNAKLSSVSVNGGDFGIKILASAGSFVIAGNGGVSTGGTIQNTNVAGVLINSYGTTSLSGIDFINNVIGIQSTGTNSLAMYNLQITGSKGYAIDSMNDLAFSLGSSSLSGNGTIGGGTIREQVTVLAPYSSNIAGNSINDSNGTAIQLLNQGGAAGSSLTSQLTSNTVIGYGSGAPLIDVNWTGPVSTNIASNVIYAHSTGMTGLSLQDASTASVLTATINSNSIYFETGANKGTGILVVDGQNGTGSTGSSNLTLTSNRIQFQGTGGTGLRFGLYEANLSSLTYNTVTDNVGGMSGLVYDYVASNSSLTINANKFTLLANDTLPHQGIVISAAAPTVTLNYVQGSPTNWIYNIPNSAAGLSMPSGIGTGGIVINNNYVAAP